MTPGSAVVVQQVRVAVETLARWEVALVAVPLLLLLCASRRRDALRAAGCLAGGVLIVLFAGGLLLQVRHNVNDPPEWDYLAFSIPARAAAQGANFYRPDVLHRVARDDAAGGKRYSEGFTRMTLDVGFFYPPASMLLFAPLGRVGPRTGIAAWQLLNLVALAVAVVLLARTFFADDPVLGLVTVALLTLGLRSTSSTVGYAQTNFLALLLLALFWRARPGPASGLALGLGAIVKPVLLLLLGHALLHRQWRGVAAALGTTAASMLAALLAFGSGTVATYHLDGPTRRIPSTVYTESVNQSLPAVLLRWTGYDGSQGAALGQPVVLAVGAAFALASIVAVVLLRRREELALTVSLAAALLLYPGTLEHYSVLLLLPLAALWRSRDDTGGTRLVLAVIAATMLLIGIQGGRTVWAAFLLVWAAAIVLGWVAVVRERRGRTPRRAPVEPAPDPA